MKPQTLEILRLAESGETIPDIMYRTGRSYDAVCSLIYAHRPDLTTEQRQEAYRMYLAGYAFIDIAAKFDRTERGIRNIVTQMHTQKPKMPDRCCNLCPRTFAPDNKFQRFCQPCRSEGRVSDSAIGGIYV